MILVAIMSHLSKSSTNQSVCRYDRVYSTNSEQVQCTKVVFQVVIFCHNFYSKFMLVSWRLTSNFFDETFTSRNQSSKQKMGRLLIEMKDG